jgi:cell volume regulation protein A
MGAEMLQVTVGPVSRLHGVEIFELRLPEGANVTLVVRGGRGFVPDTNAVIRRGDQLLIVATAESRTRAEKRVREVSRQGRLAGWNAPQPDARPNRQPRALRRRTPARMGMCDLARALYLALRLPQC